MLLDKTVLKDTQFKEALASFASGVTVVTMPNTDTGGWHGITVSSFASVSMQPPLIAFYIDHAASSLPLLKASKRFAVSILSAGQQDISNWFASSKNSRSKNPWPTQFPIMEQHGLPIVAGACAHLICDLYHTMTLGDHDLFVGQVLAAGAEQGLEPLLYHQRGYRKLETPS